MANESFLKLKKRIRERLETPLTRSLLNSEVRERENMSRKLKRDKRRSRRRDEFHTPLNGMSRDLDQTCIESQKSTSPSIYGVASRQCFTVSMAWPRSSVTPCVYGLPDCIFVREYQSSVLEC